jgi:DNA polymerase-3 subunit gamma/tau
VGQALYRKYRSKKLSEIVGQEHITRTLEHAIKSGRISHAYLFTGPRGVGKTSIARILAHEVNGLPYGDETIHLDIIEIDAASNRRIDEIRDLRDKVHISPTSATYKVYIIDEVHMLTKEAFNALLKTLEEPPAHVIFILATTEAHKLPETIVSRTQRFTFKPIKPETAVEHLKTIADDEGLDIDDDALRLLAEHGGGSFRDSISLLDQVGNSGKKRVSRKDVEAMLGIAPEPAIGRLLKAVSSGSPADVVTQLFALREQGINPAQVAGQLAARLREGLLGGTPPLPASQCLDLLGKLLAVQSSPDPGAALELDLLHANLQTAPGSPAETTVNVTETVIPIEATIEEKPAAEQKSAVEPKPDTEPMSAAKHAPEKTDGMTSEAKPSAARKSTAGQKSEAAQPEPETSAINSAGTAAPESTEEPARKTPSASAAIDTPATLTGELKEWWPKVLHTIKQHNNTLYGVLRMAEPELQDGELKLRFAFPFHQKRINETKNKEKISLCVADIVGQTLVITCVTDESLKGKRSVDVETVDFVAPEASGSQSTPDGAAGDLAGNTPLDMITSIFGGGEVLEN